MRTTRFTSRFQRDYKREKAGRHGRTLDAPLMAVVNLLAADAPLPQRNFDHPLSGEWDDFRDCHLKPDLILIYRKPDSAVWNWCASARTENLVCRIPEVSRRNNL